MAAPLDDMFSFCVDPGKVAASVEVRFIDNIKVRRVRLCQIKETWTDLWVRVKRLSVWITAGQSRACSDQKVLKEPVCERKVS